MHVDEVLTIELRRPLLLSGSVTFTSRSGKVCRVFADHSGEFRCIEELMKQFLPEKVRYVG